ncbi:conserved fungal protein [Aspergillus bombycis]|uniref:Conserved fungal protein n=1 Tax=Aspergillus bombycis TaxID=109264 RepID=A0A1F8A0J4_9EURO|nr:conserved fungal protein [Aspergillus bombycis]OGM45252.1 conserved fungal protein [Aspergillus bombycis]
MGLFKRKDSKNSIHTERDEQESFVSANSARTSNASLKSPGFKGSGSGLPASIPEISIAKPPDPALDPAAYLRSIHAVRERSRFVFGKAKRNKLNHFDVDMSKFEATASYIVSIIKRDYAPDYDSIPPHGRWQHFDIGGRPRINQLLQSWPSTIDAQERTRRLIDLFVVSVLLDAGAGTRWSYKSKESGKFFSRSEGLAVATLEMFKSGLFSSDPTEPCQVDGAGLKKITVELLAKGVQHSENNPLAGIEGRAGLLIRLSEALNNQDFFGVDARPGNMLDYLLSHPSTQASSVPIIPITTLWSVLMDGLTPIWPPSRTQIDGLSIGDAWPCSDLPPSPPAQPWETIVPFHKLTQWLCYSIMVPMSKLMKIHFAGSELLTGLPEYRNGGLLIDMGLLTLKEADAQRGIAAYKENAQIKGQPNVEVVPLFSTDDDVVVEWRAVTVGFLDELLVAVNSQLGLVGEDQLTLAQMLEAGSWKGGREIAEVSRPNTKEPPIMIRSDGTVF